MTDVERQRQQEFLHAYQELCKLCGYFIDLGCRCCDGGYVRLLDDPASIETDNDGTSFHDLMPRIDG